MNSGNMPKIESIAHRSFALLAGLFIFNQASGQVSYDTPDAPYKENFDDGLPARAQNMAWTNNFFFPGWYVYQSNSLGPPEEFRKTSGNSSKAELFQWRDSASAKDGALGTKPNDGAGDMMLGLRLTNETGKTLREFTLAYTGEQWYASQTNQNNQFVVAYQLGAVDSLADGNWTKVPKLEFNSPKNSGGDENLDGNDTDNRVVLSPVTVSGIEWKDGTDLWIRWFDSNSSGVDQGIAIDDVVFSASPAATSE